MKNDGLIEQLRNIFVDWKTFDLNLQLVKDRITPVEKIVYTVAGAFGLAAIGAIAALIYKKTP
jgi:hypothetical protein